MEQATAAFGIEWDGQGRSWFSRAAAAGMCAALLAVPLAKAVPAHADTSQVSVIVRGAPGAGAALEQAVTRIGGTIGLRLGIINAVSAKVPANKLSSLAHQSGVVEVTNDARGHLMSDVSNSGYDSGGDLGSPQNLASMINAKPAYDAGLFGKGVDVALIDSGVTPVDALSQTGKVINGPDLSFDSQAANLQNLDGYGHGTHMAGLIAGRDSSSPAGSKPDKATFTGVAPDARIVNVKVGANDGAVDVSQVIAGIDWIVQHKNDNGMNIRVVNLSFGTDSAQSYLLDPLAYATEVAWKKGIVVVVSAGNSGKAATTLSDPAIDPFVLAVGSNDPNGTAGVGDDSVASFTSLGNSSRHADILAPGKSVISLRVPNSRIDQAFPAAQVGTAYFKGSGTSQSAAVVSGAVALLLQKRPSLTPDQVKAILTSTDKNIRYPTYTGVGMIDIGKALNTNAPLLSTQWFVPSTGLGSLEASRGSAHVYDPTTGAALTGEQDIFGQTFSSPLMAASELAGSTWSGGTRNGSTWSGSTWSGSTWSGSTWSGSTWSGSTWSGSTWSGSTWSGSTWSGSTWSGSTWSGSTWSGSTWSDSAWASDTWA